MGYSLTSYLPDLPMVDIVDIGASLMSDSPDKSFTYQALLDVGKVNLTGFEGDEARAREAAQFVGPGIRILPKMIGDGGPAVFHENKYALTSSLYPANHELAAKFNNLGEYLEVVSTFDVQTHRLDDCEEIGNVDALFVDAQGAELDIIRNAGKALSTAVVVQLEVEFVELYKGQPLFSEVDRHMRSLGFMFHTFYGIGSRAFSPIIAGGNPNTGLRQHVWADAVYMPDILNYAALSEDRLLKLALIMQDVYGSTDVAFQALAEIDNRTGSQLASGCINHMTGAG